MADLVIFMCFLQLIITWSEIYINKPLRCFNIFTQIIDRVLFIQSRVQSTQN